jgi:polyferredoxin
MPVLYRIAADIVVLAHAGYVAFVLVGLLLILAGILARWGWVRNPWFRVAHVTAILIVVGEAWCGITCPLTTWENWLRRQAGEAEYQGGFFARWVHEALFITAPPWAFTLAYTAFGAGVLATLIIAPPRWRRGPAPIEAPADDAASEQA